MKANQAKAPEQKIPEKPCCICQKPTLGYGTWRDGITCSRTCEESKRDQERTLKEDWK